MMYFSDRITLRTVAVTYDSFGDEIKGYTDKNVWANKKSVTRSEFYSANMSGIKIDAVFEVHTEDFGDQTEVIFATKNYIIVRAYQKGEGTVELMCQEVV